SAFIRGVFEFGQPVDHVGNIGAVFRCGAADIFAHWSTPSALNIVANFVVVSSTSSSAVGPNSHCCDRLAGQPERKELSNPVLEAAHRDRSGAHAESAALDERQLDPARDHRTAEVT